MQDGKGIPRSSVTVRSFSVIEAVTGFTLTGGKSDRPLSDHPMLVVEVE